MDPKYSSFRKGVIDELNRMRTSPKDYASEIRIYKQYFKGKVLRLPGSSVGISTNEGPEAYEEAAQFLDNVQPVEPLKYNPGLAHIAQDLLTEIQKLGDDLDKTDSINVDKIIDKYGRFNGNFTRSMDFGSKDPKMVLINLIVSDGDKARGQRDTIFSTNLKEIGVSTGPQTTYGQCTIIVESTKFTTKKEVSDPETQTLEQKIRNPTPSQINNDDDDLELPPGVKSIDKSEKIVIENGKKKKITKLVKHMEDGSTETETTKESLE